MYTFCPLFYSMWHPHWVGVNPRLVQVFQRGMCGGETWTYKVASLLRRSPSDWLAFHSASFFSNIFMSHKFKSVDGMARCVYPNMFEAAQGIIFSCQKILFTEVMLILVKSVCPRLSKGVLRTFGEEWAMIGTSLQTREPAREDLRQAGVKFKKVIWECPYN